MKKWIVPVVLLVAVFLTTYLQLFFYLSTHVFLDLATFSTTDFVHGLILLSTIAVLGICALLLLPRGKRFLDLLFLAHFCLRVLQFCTEFRTLTSWFRQDFVPMDPIIFICALLAAAVAVYGCLVLLAASILTIQTFLKKTHRHTGVIIARVGERA